MPKIDLKKQFATKLFELRKSQRRFELILEIAEYTEGLKDKEFPGLTEEIASLFTQFATGFLESKNPLQENLIRNNRQTNKTLKIQPKNDDNSISNKVQFMLQNKHFEKKVVQFTVNNEILSGHVTGVDSPYIIFKTGDGRSIKAKPEQLKII